jgi:hypothetical protein
MVTLEIDIDHSLGKYIYENSYRLIDGEAKFENVFIEC